MSGTEREENAIENGCPAVEAGRNTDEEEEQVGRSEIIAEAGNGSTEPGVETDQNTTQDTALQEQDSNNAAQRKRRQLPLQPVRKSERHRKLPTKYDDFHMFSLVNRPFDNRFHALEVLMSSGILKSMECEIARKIVNAIMK